MNEYTIKRALQKFEITLHEIKNDIQRIEDKVNHSAEMTEIKTRQEIEKINTKVDRLFILFETIEEDIEAAHEAAADAKEAAEEAEETAEEIEREIIEDNE